jgi:hypothetical protein
MPTAIGYIRVSTEIQDYCVHAVKGSRPFRDYRERRHIGEEP